MAFPRFPNVFIRDDHFEEDVKLLIKEIRPDWNIECLKIKKFDGGVSNVLFGVYLDEKLTNETDMVLVRIYGKMLLDRNMEMENMSALSKHNLAARVWGKFENGCSYQFLQGTVLNRSDVRDEKCMPLIINELVKLHTVKLDLHRPKEPFLFPKMREMADHLPDTLNDPDNNEKYINNYPNKSKIFEEIECLEKHLIKRDYPVTFCHNDLVVNNLIMNLEKNRIHFIDFEYADYNYCAFDIGNHFNEFAGLENIDYSFFPDKDFQKKWIRKYLECWYNLLDSNGYQPNIDKNEIDKWYIMVNKFSLASHLFWSIWSIWQHRNSVIDFDYLNYAIIRWNEYKKRKDDFITL